MIAAHEELLAAVAELGLSDRAVERDVFGDCNGFLRKARRGEREGEQAAASWKKLRAWLEVLRAPVAAVAAPVAAPAATPPASAPERLELVQAIGKATTLDLVDALINRIAEGIAEGTIEPNVGRALIDCLKEKRQVLKAIAEERARISADKPVQIEVIYRNDWRAKVEAVTQASA